jgi:DNA repair exonuclease SbcCD nuclease subunit
LKVALISDIHYGCRGDNLVFLDYTKKFLDDVFFPTLEERNIRNVIIAGDLVDRRKYVNYNTALRLRDDFLKRIADGYKMNAHILPGNHDIYHKDNNEVNALEVFCRNPCFTVIDEPSTYVFDGLKVLMVPWICPENQERVMKAIEESTADVCIGHFELQGFTMYPGMVCAHGMSPSILSKFKLVCSGHFHSTSRKGNILYLGAPIQMTWNDYDDHRGFYILDTDTLEYEYIRNPYEIFAKIPYDDADKTMDEAIGYDYSKYSNCYVKVVVNRKTNPYWFDLFIEKLEEYATDVKIIDTAVENIIDLDDSSQITADKVMDTATILRVYVDQLEDVKVDKQPLQDLLVGLYNEAIQLGV